MSEGFSAFRLWKYWDGRNVPSLSLENLTKYYHQYKNFDEVWYKRSSKMQFSIAKAIFFP